MTNIIHCKFCGEAQECDPTCSTSIINTIEFKDKITKAIASGNSCEYQVGINNKAYPVDVFEEASAVDAVIKTIKEELTKT